MSRVSLLAAIGARTRALGKNNDLLFKIPADMKRFRSLTRDHPVVMGRKTWESLPEKFRPLPGRTNIVITRNESYDAPGAIVVPSFTDALEKAKEAPGNDEIFVIGGGEIYRESLPSADRLYLTLVDDDTEGDVHFPEYGTFTKVLEETPGEHEGLRFTYLTLER